MMKLSPQTRAKLETITFDDVPGGSIEFHVAFDIYFALTDETGIPHDMADAKAVQALQSALQI